MRCARGLISCGDLIESNKVVSGAIMLLGVVFICVRLGGCLDTLAAQHVPII